MNGLLDASNAELYRLAIHDVPYVVAAYAVLWVALVGYVSLVLGRLMRLEKQMQIIEESCERKSAGGAS